MELYEATAIAQTQDQPYQAISGVIARTRESVDLERVLKTTVTEVRQVLNADRAAVVRLSAESGYKSGEIVAEDVLPPWESALADQIPECCFEEAEAAYYQQGRIHALSDVDRAGLNQSYADLLKHLQVRSMLVLPLHKGERLWGLLCIHQCREVREWKTIEIDFPIQIAAHLGMTIQHADYVKKLQAQAAQLKRVAQREKALARTIDRIRRSLHTDTIFKSTTEEVREILNVDRVVVYRFNPDWSGSFVAESVAQGWNPLMREIATIADTHLQETQGGRYRNNESIAIADIYKAGHAECHVQLLEKFQARAYTIVPISQGETLWGLLAAYQNSGPRHWETDEVELLAQIGVQFGIAVQQAELLEKTRRQTEELTQTLHHLQQTQTQLIHSEKMASLGQLVAGVAHEINNPINFIHGNLNHATDYTQDLLQLMQLYQQHYPKPAPEIREYAQDIELDFLREDLPKLLSSMQVGIDRIRGLVFSLRNFSRLDQAEKKPVDLHEGIESTLLILQHRLKTKPHCKGIKLIKDYGKLSPVECYAAQMNQVFMNILSNAIDALEEHGTWGMGHPEEKLFCAIDERRSMTNSESPTIRISTAAIADRCVMIRIADNGPGIAEEVRSRIFDPFFTTKPVGEGTGLGLSITYQIVVQKHGGSIKCLSKPGQGTEFWIEIPLNQVQVTSKAA